MQNIAVSKMLYAVKGDNSSQIIKNIALHIGKDINLSVMSAHQRLEKLLQGSIVGIGEGVAVFDWVSDKVDEPYIACVTLDIPAAFPAVDENLIDIVLILVSPEKNGPLHLQYLSRLTRMFRDENRLSRLRSVTCIDGMISVLTPEHHHSIAA